MQTGRFCRNVRRSGFTFAEVLAAMIFLAILIPAVVEGLSLSNRAAVVTERRSVALQLADRQLAEMQLNDAWVTWDQSGDFGPEWAGYRWEMRQAPWTEDDMTELTVDVFFEVQGRELAVSLTTLVDDTSL